MSQTPEETFDCIVRDVQARCMAANHHIQLAQNDLHEAMNAAFERLKSIARTHPHSLSENRSVVLSELSNLIKGFTHPYPGVWDSRLFGVPAENQENQ